MSHEYGNPHKVRPDQLYGVRMKTIEIGGWNMDTTETKNVAHGLVLEKIRSAMGVVRRDDYDHIHMLPDFSIANNRIELFIVEIGATYIELKRLTNG